MISAEEQKKVADLVKQTKDLILKEMDEEEVMIKGAANYVTNVDLAVQNFLKEELGKVFPEISLNIFHGLLHIDFIRINHTGFWIPLTEPPI